MECVGSDEARLRSAIENELKKTADTGGQEEMSIRASIRERNKPGAGRRKQGNTFRIDGKRL